MNKICKTELSQLLSEFFSGLSRFFSSAQSRSGRNEVFRESSGENVERSEIFRQLGPVVSGSSFGSGLALHDELGQGLSEGHVSFL